MGDASKAAMSADALAGASLQTMSISTTGSSLAPWKETEKWGGKPSEKKAYFAKANSQLKPHPQKMRQPTEQGGPLFRNAASTYNGYISECRGPGSVYVKYLAS